MVRGFQYYFPGVGRMPEASPLYKYALSGTRHCRPLNPGPDGRDGFLMAEHAALLGNLERVEWEWGEVVQHSEIDSREYWIGLDSEASPGPTDLAREEIIGGHEVKLSDNSFWTIPMIRDFVGGSQLPTRWSLGPKGEWVSERLPQYIQLWDAACKMFDAYMAMVEAEQESFAVKDGLDFACECIALNYRVSKREIALLRLLDSRNDFVVIGAACDAFKAMEFYKYKQDEKKNCAETTGGT